MHTAGNSDYYTAPATHHSSRQWFPAYPDSGPVPAETGSNGFTNGAQSSLDPGSNDFMDELQGGNGYGVQLPSGSTTPLGRLHSHEPSPQSVLPPVAGVPDALSDLIPWIAVADAPSKQPAAAQATSVAKEPPGPHRKTDDDLENIMSLLLS